MLRNQRGLALVVMVFAVSLVLATMVVVLLNIYRVKVNTSHRFRKGILSAMVIENFGPLVSAAYEQFRTSGGACAANYVGLPTGNPTLCFMNDVGASLYTCINHPVAFGPGAPADRKICLTPVATTQSIQQVASLQIANPQPFRSMYAWAREALPYVLMDVMRPFAERSVAVAAPPTEEHLPNIDAEVIPTNQIVSGTPAPPVPVPYSCVAGGARNEMCMQCDYSAGYTGGGANKVPCINFRFCLFPDPTTDQCDDTVAEQWVYARYALISN